MNERLSSRKKEPSELSATGLASLLGLALETHADETHLPEDQRRGKLLKEKLAARLPLGPDHDGALDTVNEQLFQIHTLLTQRPIGETLTDPSADSSAIRDIKVFAKRMSFRAKSPLDREIAAAIYYTAIASAIVFCGKRITSLGSDHLASEFTRLRRQGWIPASLSMILSAAAELCSRHQLGSQESG